MHAVTAGGDGPLAVRKRGSAASSWSGRSAILAEYVKKKSRLALWIQMYGPVFTPSGALTGVLTRCAEALGDGRVQDPAD